MIGNMIGSWRGGNTAEGVEAVEAVEGVKVNTLDHMDDLGTLDTLGVMHFDPAMGATILPPMLRDRALLGVWIGLVAAAATAGTLVGFGWSRGGPLQALNTVAHIVMGSRAFYVREAHAVVTSVAVLVHAASLAAWGVLFSLAMGRFRSAPVSILALLFTALVALVDFVVLPERFSPGFETVLTRAEVIVVYAVMAAAMALGGKASGTVID